MVFNSIIGGKISAISRICDLISIEIETVDKKKTYLHIQSFFRIIKFNEIIVSSEDMYRCFEKEKKENFKWDIPGDSIYDHSLKQCINEILKLKIVDVHRNNIGDLSIILENDISLQTFINTCEEEEKYRIFNDLYCVEVKSGIKNSI